MRDYRHEELIGGKERTLKIGDRVRTYYTRKEGVIVGPCPRHSGNWHVDVGDGTCDVKCVAECNLTPVEPERVKWYYRMSCATRSCAANDEGMCNVSINGLATCSKHQWPKPSPGLLQRMGMATWEEEKAEWFVMAMPKSENAGWMLGTMMTKAQAEKALSSWCLRPDCEYRILRWQDGVQG